jgi:hypothetical protein
MLQVVRSRPSEDEARVDAARYWLDSRPLAGRATCGDFAGCFPVGSERLAIVVGDVAGRGPAAGAAAHAVFERARRELRSRRPLAEAVLGLGRLARCGFAERTVRWDARSVLVAVTDGVTEARGSDAGRPHFFGSFAVARAFASARRARVDPARAIGEAARRHANGRSRDDATVLVVRSGRPLS